ncbi:hypothetical protein EPR50_G00018660 [Perca flavescens]|uniref:Uncharacterized protein n=1 Tax=Perca flavescens TaxID=8167 RepID=A0A484DLE2_PERFV|nr:hypothetical protein EPR50_G00018660 [Perca flavescens]
MGLKRCPNFTDLRTTVSAHPERGPVKEDEGAFSLDPHPLPGVRDLGTGGGEGVYGEAAKYTREGRSG